MAKELVLPSNVEAERTVLGAMLIDTNALSVGIGSLTVDSFSDVDKRNKAVFRAMVELTKRHMAVDVQTVHDELVTMKLDKEADSPEYLLELIDTVTSTSSIDHYIKIVRDHQTLRELLVQIQKIQDDYAEKEIRDIGDFVANASSSISEIANARQVGDFKTAAEAAKEMEIRMDQMAQSDTGDVTGITTGYKRLDELTHGWQKEDLIIVAARPSMGKTALTMNFAYNAAFKAKVPVAFFSLEMNANLIMQRLVASRAYVNGNSITTGHLTKHDRVAVAGAIQEISGTKLYIDDTPNAMIGDIIAKATKLKAKEPNLGLIVIDYLGRIRSAGKAESRQQEVSEISGSLKTLARQLKVPVIVCAQLNRGAEGSDSKKPMISNLRESGSIEQDADLVLLLYREDYYEGHLKKKQPYGQAQNEEQEEKKADEPKKDTPGDISILQVDLAKNRNGKTENNIRLIFSKAYSRFDSPSQEYQHAYQQFDERRANFSLDDDE